jgi:hypothetical protein
LRSGMGRRVQHGSVEGYCTSALCLLFDIDFLDEAICPSQKFTIGDLQREV